MHFYTALALAGSTGLATAIPHTLRPRALAAFPAGTSWDILLSKSGVGNVRAASKANVEVIDVDLFDTDAATIADLKKDKKVICYFSAGSREDWRPDVSAFKSADYGKPLDGWDGENWLDIKSENVLNIMKKRIELAAEKGCDAIDPDNVDGYNNNQDGFSYSPSDHATFIQKLSTHASSKNLATGLKNAIELVPQVLPYIHFAVNEACHEYNECSAYAPLTAANLAVFNIEYGGNDCGSPAGVKLSTLIKPEDQSLSTLGSGGCPNEPNPSNTIGDAPTPTKVGEAPVQSSPAQTAVPGPVTTAVPEPSEEEDPEGEEDEGACVKRPFWWWGPGFTRPRKGTKGRPTYCN